MSTFTKRRKALRKQQEEWRKIQDEHSKQFDKSMEAHLETCRIIKKDYPGYNNMKPNNAFKLYYEIYNKIMKGDS